MGGLRVRRHGGGSGDAARQHVMRKEPEYSVARERMIADAEAAIGAALPACTTDPVASRADDCMGNPVRGKLSRDARLVSWITELLGMMQGGDGRDTALLVVHHAKDGCLVRGHGADAVRQHGQLNPSRRSGGGGESKIKAPLPGRPGVPVVFPSSEDSVRRIVEREIGPWVRTAVVQKGIGRGAAESPPRDVVAGALRDGGAEAPGKPSEARLTMGDLPSTPETRVLLRSRRTRRRPLPWAEPADRRTLRFESGAARQACQKIQALGVMTTSRLLLRHVQSPAMGLWRSTL